MYSFPCGYVHFPLFMVTLEYVYNETKALEIHCLEKAQTARALGLYPISARILALTPLHSLGRSYSLGSYFIP